MQDQGVYLGAQFDFTTDDDSQLISDHRRSRLDKTARHIQSHIADTACTDTANSEIATAWKSREPNVIAIGAAPRFHIRGGDIAVGLHQNGTVLCNKVVQFDVAHIGENDISGRIEHRVHVRHARIGRQPGLRPGVEPLTADSSAAVPNGT